MLKQVYRFLSIILISNFLIVFNKLQKDIINPYNSTVQHKNQTKNLLSKIFPLRSLPKVITFPAMAAMLTLLFLFNSCVSNLFYNNKIDTSHTQDTLGGIRYASPFVDDAYNSYPKNPPAVQPHAKKDKPDK